MPRPLLAIHVAAHYLNPNPHFALPIAEAFPPAIRLLALSSVHIGAILLYAYLVRTLRRYAKFLVALAISRLYSMLCWCGNMLLPVVGDGRVRVDKGGSGVEYFEGVMYRNVEHGHWMLEVEGVNRISTVCICRGDIHSPFTTCGDAPCTASLSVPKLAAVPASKRPLPPFAVQPKFPAGGHLLPNPILEKLTIHLDQEEFGRAYTHTGRISQYRRRQLLDANAIPTAIRQALDEISTLFSGTPSQSSSASPSSSMLCFLSEEESEAPSVGPATPARASTSATPQIRARQISIGTALYQFLGDLAEKGEEE